MYIIIIILLHVIMWYKLINLHIFKIVLHIVILLIF